DRGPRTHCPQELRDARRHPLAHQLWCEVGERRKQRERIDIRDRISLSGEPAPLGERALDALHRHPEALANLREKRLVVAAVDHRRPCGAALLRLEPLDARAELRLIERLQRRRELSGTAERTHARSELQRVELPPGARAVAAEGIRGQQIRGGIRLDDVLENEERARKHGAAVDQNRPFALEIQQRLRILRKPRRVLLEARRIEIAARERYPRLLERDQRLQE